MAALACLSECEGFEIMLLARPRTLRLHPNLALRFKTCMVVWLKRCCLRVTRPVRSPASILITILVEGRLGAREKDPPLLAEVPGVFSPQPNSALQHGAMDSKKMQSGSRSVELISSGPLYAAASQLSLTFSFLIPDASASPPTLVNVSFVHRFLQ